MVQAVEQYITSRRKFLVSAALAGAIAAPSVAGASAVPDAELIALGRLHDDLTKRHAAAVVRFAPFWARFDARDPAEDWQGAYARVFRELGFDKTPAGGHPDDILNEIDPVARAILAIPATTISGLAVKARLAKFGAEHLWNENDADADWGDLVTRKLIDSVIGVATSVTI